MLAWSLLALDACELDTIVVVCHPDRVAEYRAQAVDPLALATSVVFARGGESRQESVASGLASLPEGIEIVIVHDGARPLLRPETALGALAMLRSAPDADGVIVGHPSVDTLKIVEAGRIVETADRSVLWAVQTPQIFRVSALRAAHEASLRDGFAATDDSALVERCGGIVRVFEGPRDNIKITVPEDRAFAEGVLHAPRGGEVGAMRIGIGYDVHAFEAGRKLVLGGVEIDHEHGLAGHSDADVLAHALMDALLGALREGDVGKLFPDTDPRFAGADSMMLLREVARLVRDSGFVLEDADCVLVLEEPKIAPVSRCDAAEPCPRNGCRSGAGGGQGHHHRRAGLRRAPRGRRGLRRCASGTSLNGASLLLDWCEAARSRAGSLGGRRPGRRWQCDSLMTYARSRNAIRRRPRR